MAKRQEHGHTGGQHTAYGTQLYIAGQTHKATRRGWASRQGFTPAEALPLPDYYSCNYTTLTYTNATQRINNYTDIHGNNASDLIYISIAPDLPLMASQCNYALNTHQTCSASQCI